MMRRFQPAIRRQIAPSNSVVLAAPPSAGALSQQRHYTGPLSIIFSLTTCWACCICGGIWAQNICNVNKFGLYRFKNHFDESILPVDYKHARWFGAFLGAIFYWFLVGPDKYRRSDMEKWQPRFGPF